MEKKTPDLRKKKNSFPVELPNKLPKEVPLLVKKNKGFSLIEILVVLGIMGAVLTLGLSRVKRNDNNIKSVVRRMMVLAKEIRNKARLSSSTYRIVFQLSDQDPSYWVESSLGRHLRESEEERKKRERDEQNQSKDSKKSGGGGGFSRDDRFGKKPKVLPSGLFFASVEIAGTSEITTSGTEFIYFSPDGFVEPGIVQITDKKKITWSLVFNPLTGQVDILPEAKALKDIAR